MKEKSLAARMKDYYEHRSMNYLTRRTPVILRLDGKAFHTFTKNKAMNFERPFDEDLADWMVEATQVLCQEIQGAKLGYTQSDEISILVSDFDSNQSEAWFDYKVQKMVSVAASIATAVFTKNIIKKGYQIFDIDELPMANFDCRAFNIPIADANNYFVWRQRDWARNSVQMLARAHFSHKELQQKGKLEMLSMLEKKEVIWEDLNSRWRLGSTLTRQVFEKPGTEGQVITRSKWVTDHYWDFKDITLTTDLLSRKEV